MSEQFGVCGGQSILLCIACLTFGGRGGTLHKCGLDVRRPCPTKVPNVLEYQGLIPRVLDGVIASGCQPEGQVWYPLVGTL